VSRRIGVGERRARLAVRHRLASESGAAAVTDVADALVALHSTDPATVYLSVAARQREPDFPAIERALYEERTLVRILGMRRTIFVVPRDLVAVVHASTTRAIAAEQRRRLTRTLEDYGGIADAGEWLRRVEAACLRVVGERGEVFGADVSAEVPELRTQILMNEGKKYEGLLNLTTRVLFLLSIIWDFGVFTQAYLVTGELGNRDEYNLGIYAYDRAFTMPPSYGVGSALALILTVILLIITVGYVRASVRQGAIR